MDHHWITSHFCASLTRNDGCIVGVRVRCQLSVKVSRRHDVPIISVVQVSLTRGQKGHVRGVTSSQLTKSRVRSELFQNVLIVIIIAIYQVATSRLLQPVSIESSHGPLTPSLSRQSRSSHLTTGRGLTSSDPGHDNTAYHSSSRRCETDVESSWTLRRRCSAYT